MRLFTLVTSVIEIISDYPVGQSVFDMKMTEKQDKCPIEMKF